MELERVVVAVVIFVIGLVAAGAVDRVLARKRDLPPEALTRYRVIRRTAYVLIVLVSAAIAALTFPVVRVAAGALLTSAAVLSVMIGIAARSSLGNFVSGLVLAFSQPIRIGDQIEFRGVTGTVDDVGRIYTRVRTSAAGGCRCPTTFWPPIPS